MSTTQQRLADYLSTALPEMIDLCTRLVQTPSVNGVNDELAVATLISEQAQRLGLPATLTGENRQRPNVIVSTSLAGPTGMLLVGHLDTVPEGDTSRWTHPPFGGHITTGKVFGRGAIDNKGGMVAALYSLAALASVDGVLPQGRVQFIGVPDEESGATGTLGVNYLSRAGLLDGLGAIYTYPGMIELPLGHRGITRFNVTAHGVAAHTGISGRIDQPSPGRNAVTAMADFLLRLEQNETPGSHLEYFDQYRAVINPGTIITGGTSVNMVPDRCEALVEIRTIPEFDRPEAEAVLKQAIAAVENNRPDVQFSYQLLNHVPAALSDTNSPLFDIVQRAAHAVTGYTPERVVCGPANEGYLFIEQDIPIVCGFGPTGKNAHAIDEYVEIDSLSKAALIYALAAIELAQHL